MTKFVAGTYKQHYKYKSFLPSLLSPFDWQTQTVIKLLTEASRELGELNTYAKLVPDINFFIEMHKVKEATTSSRIEGTHTKIDEALLTEKEINPEKRDDWHEVRNYIDALNYAIERLEELPLCIRLLKETHKILMRGVRGEHKMPGEIRSSQNWIGGADIASASFVPPHPEDIPNLLSDLEKYWHNADHHIPTLIKIAVSHYQFETIHPFSDGNGRIGRLLITLQLLEAKLLDKPILYISDFFERNRGAYYDALARVTLSNDIDHWLRFFLTGIIETTKNSKTAFNKIGRLRTLYNAKILKMGRRSKLASLLLEKMFSNPIVTPRKVEDLLGIAPATANRLLEEMEKTGILKETTGYSRNRVFVLYDYLDIFRKP